MEVACAMKYLATFVVFLFVSGLSYAADKKPLQYQLKPESIMHEIKSRGAKKVVSELYSDWNVWYSVLKKIASADELWLRTAVDLRAGSDAGESEMLDLAIGEALEHNPAIVFRIALKGFQISDICGSPDVDDARYNSYELSIRAINLRIRNVAAVKDPAFATTSKECIRYLEASKEGIARFFGVKK